MSAQPGRSAMSWWRSHSVRLSLTLWNVAAMLLVLAVYAGAVFLFVSRNASRSLDAEVRYDYQWAAAMADQLPGRIAQVVRRRRNVR